MYRRWPGLGGIWTRVMAANTICVVVAVLLFLCQGAVISVAASLQVLALGKRHVLCVASILNEKVVRHRGYELGVAMSQSLFQYCREGEVSTLQI